MGKSVCEKDYHSFFQASEVEGIPVLEEIFSLPGVCSLFIAPDFITVTKSEEVTWSLLESVIFSILTHYQDSFPLTWVKSATELPPVTVSLEGWKPEDPHTEAICKEIEELLASKIRPNVEADGGAISFKAFVDGVVYVQLWGACASCPHSTQTLQHGVEQLLRFYIPEVKSVCPMD